MSAETATMDGNELESLSFEDSYSRLEQVIRTLEEGNLTLEESVALYEQGMSLAQRCAQHLQRAELKVAQLLEGTGLAGEEEDLL